VSRIKEIDSKNKEIEVLKAELETSQSELKTTKNNIKELQNQLKTFVAERNTILETVKSFTEGSLSFADQFLSSNQQTSQKRKNSTHSPILNKRQRTLSQDTLQNDQDTNNCSQSLLEFPSNPNVPESPKSMVAKKRISYQPSVGTDKADSVTYVIGFSNFSSKEDGLMKDVKKMALDLGKKAGINVRILKGDYQDDITHLIFPYTVSATPKVLSALVTCRWVGKSSWIIDSAKAGEFLPEGKYGFRFDKKPIDNKKFFY